MDNIIEPNENFNFLNLSLAQPVSIQGGAYFTKILFENKPLYIQTPKSSTRQGFLKTGKKINCDLMFDNNDETFIHWLENLETKCQQLIFEKSSEWFQNSLEMTDIETAFNSPMKIYKSGKFYLVRTNVKINSLTNHALIKIYNENETPLSMDDINTESNIISILEIQGIKFTSRNFQIEIELKQVMLLNKDVLFENCLIKKKNGEIEYIKTNVTPIKKEFMIEHAINDNNIPVDNITGDNITDDIIDDDNVLDNNTNVIDKHDVEEKQVEKTSIESLSSSSSSSSFELDNLTNSILANIQTSNVTNENDITRDLIKPTNTNTIIDLIELNTPLGITELTEFNIEDSLENNLETMTLKKPNEVYYEMYKEAREKAKKAKKESLMAFLEAKNIKQTYMLDDIDSSDDDDDDDDDDNFSQRDEDDEEEQEEEEEQLQH